MDLTCSLTGEHIRYIGRWHEEADRVTTVTPGAFMDIAFTGCWALLHFDVSGMSQPYSHLWIQVDGGVSQEVPLGKHIRIQAQGDGNHVARIIFKSAVSCNQRWYPPLDAAVIFLGFDAEGAGVLPPKKKTMAFVGDSITEGVTVDVDTVPGWTLGGNLVYQNDAAATYAWHTASLLGYDPIIQGFGSSGVTRGGLGGVPKAGEAYRYCYYEAPIAYDAPKIVVINHGVNDKDDTPENFRAGYLELLDTVRQLHPQAAIVLLQPFLGIWSDELRQIARERGLLYISTEGWYDNSLLHPLRPGHRQIATRLAEVLKKEGVCGF